jgi:outer membrane biosynthesis protein TonB
MDRLPPFADRKPTVRSRLTVAGIVAALHLLFILALITAKLAPHVGIANRAEEAWITMSVHTDQPQSRSSQKPNATITAPSEVSKLPSLQASPAPGQPSADVEQAENPQGATSSSSASSDPAAVSPDVVSDFQDQLVAHIQPFQRYPQNAGAGKPQGTTLIVFSMNRGGAILDVWF